MEDPGGLARPSQARSRHAGRSARPSSSATITKAPAHPVRTARTPKPAAPSPMPASYARFHTALAKRSRRGRPAELLTERRAGSTFRTHDHPRSPLSRRDLRGRRRPAGPAGAGGPGARGARPRRRAPGPGRVPGLLRAGGAPAVRARDGGAPFVLVGSRRPRLRRRAGGRLHLRDGVVGPGAQRVGQSLRGRPDGRPARRRRRRRGTCRRPAGAHRARARLHRRGGRALPRRRDDLQQRPAPRLRRHHGAPLSRLPAGRGGRHLPRPGDGRHGSSHRHHLRPAAGGHRHPRSAVRPPSGSSRPGPLRHPRHRLPPARQPGTARGAPLCVDRAGGAPRAAHAVAHLHSPGPLGRGHRLQSHGSRGGRRLRPGGRALRA